MRKPAPFLPSKRQAPIRLEKLVCVRPSPIHGKGLFALRFIPEGTKIGEFKGRKTIRNGVHVLWSEVNGRPEAMRVLNQLRFINHSDDPNAYVEGFSVYARKDIEKNDEITFNYDGLSD